MGWVIENCSSATALEAVASENMPPDLAAQKGSALLMKMLLGKYNDNNK
jgi:hypothetical protein